MAEQQVTDLPASNSNLQRIGGIPFTRLYKKEIIEDIMKFMPKDDDVIIASYPKTGSTWMQYIVTQILTKAECFPTFDEKLENVIPFLETSGVSAVEAMTSKPRVYKHHLPYNVMKKSIKAKIIYTYRKPEDTLVSFYHFLNDMNGKRNFDEHFEDFVTGNITYGRYFEHVLSYLQHKDDGNILFVSYEKLKIHNREEILRLAKFLGKGYYNALSNDNSVLDRIIEHTSFDYMKKNLEVANSKDSKEETSQKGMNFFRKGIIGDGKRVLTDFQFDQLKKIAAELMEGTSILAEWYDASTLF